MPPFRFTPVEPRFTTQVADLLAAPNRANARLALTEGDARAAAEMAKGQSRVNTAQAIGTTGQALLALPQQLQAQRLEQTKASTELQAAEAEQRLSALFQSGQEPTDTEIKATGIHPDRALALINAKNAAREVAKDQAREDALDALFAANPNPPDAEVVKIAGPKLGYAIVQGRLAMTPKPMILNAGDTLVSPTGDTLASAPSRPVAVRPGGSLVDPNTGETTYTAPPAPPPPITPYQAEQLKLEKDRLARTPTTGQVTDLALFNAKREAEAHKATALTALETRYRNSQPMGYEKDGTPIRARNAIGNELPVMTPAQLQTEKTRIQNTYLAEIGAAPATGAPAATGGSLLAAPPSPAAAPPPPAVAPQAALTGAAAKAKAILQANGYDSSEAAVQTFLKNPKNRAAVGLP